MEPARQLLPDGWQIHREGIWAYCDGPNRSIPGEGWKLHVSGTTHTATSLIERLVPVFVDEDVSFKFAADRILLSLMNGKRWNRGGSGKFMTIYPRDVDHFKRLARRIDEQTQGFEGPYILTDRRYMDSKVVYYRYGTMLPQSALSADGRRISVLIAEDGSLVEDKRQPEYFLPPWAKDPFGQEPDNEKTGPVILNNGRYRIDHPIAFSNSGGVYVAKDARTDEYVILKEARPKTNWTSIDVDAPVMLAKEHRLLEKLKQTGFTPKPIELFTEWEHTFLAQERIYGYTLHSTGVSETPLIKVQGTADTKKFLQSFLDIFRSLADAIASVHEAGIVFGDLSPSNVLWLRDEKKVVLIDLEGAIELGVDHPPRLSTLGFEAPGIQFGYEPSFDDDWYAYAAMALNFMLPIAEMTRLAGVDLPNVVRKVSQDAGLPAKAADVLASLLSAAGDRKVRVDEFVAQLEMAVCTGVNSVQRTSIRKPDRGTVESIAAYIIDSADLTRNDRLFPADFHIFSTNALSVAYGAAGTLAALQRAAIEVPQSLVDWLATTPISQSACPPNLSLGSAGVAWSLLDLGREGRAEEIMRGSRSHPLIDRSPGLAIGAAGWGLANLRFFLETNDYTYFAEAEAVAQSLERTCLRDAHGVRWESFGETPYGLFHGSSGIGLFLAYFAGLTDSSALMRLSADALRFDLSRGSETPDGSLSWSYGTQMENIWLPYYEYGSAGVGAALLRISRLGGFEEEFEKSLDLIFRDSDRQYSITRGIHTGLAGIGMFLLDGLQFTGDQRYLRAAESAADTILFYEMPRPNGLAFPGDYLTRLTCDYATGSAGVLSFFDRLLRGGSAPYLLDDYFFGARVPIKQNAMVTA